MAQDYIHVVDLANAHVKAIDYLNKPLITNIGTVLEMIKASNTIQNRRAGDIANPSFGMGSDKNTSNNPDGYNND